MRRRRAVAVGMTAYVTSFLVACTALTSLDDLKATAPSGPTEPGADSAIATPSDGDAVGDTSVFSEVGQGDTKAPIADASVPPSYTIDGASLPGPPPSTCSVGMAQDAQAQTLTFENNTQSDVEIWWVNQQCQEVFYYVLESEEDRTQNTYVTHVWRAREPATLALVREVGPRPNALPTTVSIP